MLNLVKQFLSVLILQFFVVGFAVEVKAGNEVYWPFFNIPPLCKIHADGQFSGLGPEMASVLQSHLKAYDHHTIAASPLKIFQSVREGRKWVLSGLLKTKSREKNLYYSKLPSRLTWTVLAITRKGDDRYVDSQGVFRAGAALNDSAYGFGYIRGIDYGDLNSLVFDHLNNQTPAFSSNDFEKLMELLVLKRIDFFLAGPLIAYYISKDSNLADQIEIVPCLEVPPQPIYGYYAVPKNEWGRTMIAKIDAIMEQMIRTGTHKEILQRWVPPQFQDIFERDYKIGFEGALVED